MKTITTALAVCIFLAFTGNLQAENNERNISLQASTGLYPALSRVVYKSDPPKYGPVLPWFRYEGYIATPSVAYNWNNNILAVGVRIYLPENTSVRTGTQLSYDRILRRPGKIFDYTLGTELLYNYHKREGTYFNNNFSPSKQVNYTTISNDFILFGTAGIRKEYESKLYLFGTTGVGILVPETSTSVYVEDIPDYNLGARPSRIYRLKSNLMMRFGVGYRF
jgi:hypothetical protein